MTDQLHRLRVPLFAAATTVVLSFVADAAVNVNVTGHETLSSREIRRTLVGPDEEAPDRERIASGVDSLLSRYVRLGRPFARVSVSWDTLAPGAEIRVAVDEGPRVRLSALHLTDRGSGEGGPDLSRIRLKQGLEMTPRDVDGEVSAVLDEYADNGYPFARAILPREVEIRDGHVALDLNIERGLRTVFGQIVVSGNDQTRDYVITRETGIAPGRPFSQSDVDDVRSSLERLSFLRAVSEPVVAVDPATGVATVGVEVSEAASNRISGVFGFSGAGGDEELTGLVDFSLGNIMGTGRSASVSWEQFRANQQEISFSYIEPWVLGAPVDVGVAGSQSVRDTLYTTTEGDLFFTGRFGGRTMITWSIGAERYVPGTGDESSTTSTRMALSAAYDAADTPVNPTTGYRLEAGAVYAAKEVVDGKGDESSTTFRLSGERYLRVTRGQVVALRGRAALLTSTEQDVPLHELLTLGGARSLRGYREEQFHGTRTALGSVEYRFLLTRRSRALAFVDVGYWYRGGSNPAKGTKLGYGIGLRGETRLGTISIDYGLGEGDGLLDGKLHAGLAREF